MDVPKDAMMNPIVVHLSTQQLKKNVVLIRIVLLQLEHTMTISFVLKLRVNLQHLGVSNRFTNFKHQCQGHNLFLKPKSTN